MRQFLRLKSLTSIQCSPEIFPIWHSQTQVAFSKTNFTRFMPLEDTVSQHMFLPAPSPQQGVVAIHKTKCFYWWEIQKWMCTCRTDTLHRSGNLGGHPWAVISEQGSHRSLKFSENLGGHPWAAISGHHNVRCLSLAVNLGGYPWATIPIKDRPRCLNLAENLGGCHWAAIWTHRSSGFLNFAELGGRPWAATGRPDRSESVMSWDWKVYVASGNTKKGLVHLRPAVLFIPCSI